MQRRNFVTAASAALGVAAAEQTAETAGRRQYFLLHSYYMRSGPQVDRTTRFLGSAYLPAAKRAGAKMLGFFSPVIGEHSPFILAVAVYPSMAALESSQARMAADKEFQTAEDAYDVIGDPAYIRIETELLRAFDRIPELTAPSDDGKRAARIFEMRTYESPSEKAGRRKIKMFEDGEAGIFRRLGMAPVFFGKGLIGANLPSLTYMLSYEDLASRDRLWKAFGADPEWQKLRVQPGLSDAEIVSNISNRILRPLSFSEIR
jgi:NIPSNAP